jgi:excinuclease ABC subunit B
VRKSIGDIMGSIYERDRVTVDAGFAEDIATYGHNFEAVLKDLDKQMRKAAEDLDFEEAARLRDELKRLREVELAFVDDPTQKMAAKAESYAGQKKFGAPLPAGRKPSSTAGRSGQRAFKRKGR